MASLFPQRLATEAEKFQMEHVWRDDSEVSDMFINTGCVTYRSSAAIELNESSRWGGSGRGLYIIHDPIWLQSLNTVSHYSYKHSHTHLTNNTINNTLGRNVDDMNTLILHILLLCLIAAPTNMKWETRLISIQRFGNPRPAMLCFSGRVFHNKCRLHISCCLFCN